MDSGILDKYRSFYPFDKDYPIVSLQEGNTPLIPAPRIAEKIAQTSGVKDLKVYLKFEGMNPTGSFKDRGMTYAVSQAKAEGATHIICASTGNTSASAAAYGTRAGLKTLIIIPEGKVALGKLSQAIMYGAAIAEIQGNFDEALNLVRALGETGKVNVVNSINPYRIEGQKTGAFEVSDALGQAPDFLFIPVGNAGNITAYWKGFKEYHQAGVIQHLPKMFGYEAEGSAAIVRNQVIEKPETLATAIRIGNPASWTGATSARDESGGHIGSVTDDEIVEAYKDIAGLEGVFCEPACGASVAGLYQAAKEGKVPSGATIACVITGHGLKDPDSAIRFGTPTHGKLPASLEAVSDFFNL
ncbi:MAG: threonine synthase [Cyanobacteria bacterium]|nr:threonine synthase [Cyanobacteriota bacterium]